MFTTTVGLLIAIALTVHNVPGITAHVIILVFNIDVSCSEGLSLSQSFVDQGKTPARALLRTLLVMAPQGIAAIASFFAVLYMPPLFPMISGFGAGAMLYLVFIDMQEDGVKAAPMISVFSCAIFEACRLALNWVIDSPDLAAKTFTALAWSLFAGLSTGSRAY